MNFYLLIYIFILIIIILLFINNYKLLTIKKKNLYNNFTNDKNYNIHNTMNECNKYGKRYACNYFDKNIYKNFIGQWDTDVNIVYANKAVGVMNVKHIYQFNTPEYISNNKTSIMGRVIRYTDAKSDKTIKNSQDVYLDKYNDVYSIHLYSLMWDFNNNRYNGKIIDIGDITLGDFYYNGGNQIILFNYELSKSNKKISNALVANAILNKIDKNNYIKFPSYYEVYKNI